MVDMGDNAEIADVLHCYFKECKGSEKRGVGRGMQDVILFALFQGFRQYFPCNKKNGQGLHGIRKPPKENSKQVKKTSKFHLPDMTKRLVECLSCERI